ncbi:MAG: sigma-70 family RNA polymerase sigma factor [Verrucomicrobia bacterium]|nr:sigma-70 family RNA polymerase sigma factor [Verrucomicrobiota bacterium]
MKPDESSLGNVAYRFRTTRWDVVLLSARSRAPGSQAALAELCRVYWYPLYAHVRRRGHAPEEARDLTQGFFLHVLERKTLGRADPRKGKFRSFLLGSLQNYLSTEAGRAGCLKRGGKVAFVSLDLQAAEERYRLEPVEALTPEKVFAARWAMALLDEALSRLRRQYAAEDKAATVEVLKAFLDVGNGNDPPSYEQAAAVLQVSVGAVKTLVHRLRKQYTALVRDEIGRTVSDPADVGAEIHELCDALVAAEGWIMP